MKSPIKQNISSYALTTTVQSSVLQPETIDDIENCFCDTYIKYQEVIDGKK